MESKIDTITQIAKKIERYNGRLYLVGGCIRDELLQLPIHDYDCCITGLTSDIFLSLFPHAKTIGKHFPVFLLDGIEFALARKEKKIAKGHLGFNMYSDKTIMIEEDLKRRDITINAIAKDVLTGEFIDPFHGIFDLKNGIIKHVSEAFVEDPLRAYRVARFACTYQFQVHDSTYQLMKLLKEELSELSVERVFQELRKSLQSPKPSIFFDTLKQADILDVHFPEIFNLLHVPQPEQYHPEGDVYQHTMCVLDKVAQKTNDEVIRFCALTHDFGKAYTPKEILPRHIHHEIVGLEIIKDFCNRLHMPTIWKKKAIACCKYHMKAGICHQMKSSKLASFLNEVNHSSITLSELNMISNADDMLQRKHFSYASLGKDMLQTVNGKTLRKDEITLEKLGIKKFKQILHQKQTEFIKREREHYLKES